MPGTCSSRGDPWEGVALSAPTGIWYLNGNNYRLRLYLWDGGTPGTYEGTLFNEKDARFETVDSVTWNAPAGELEFRREVREPHDVLSQWYRGTVVEGVLVGRFSHSTSSAARPALPSAFAFHVTGWHGDAFESDITPRVFVVYLFDTDFGTTYKAWLRLDRDAAGGLLGRLKSFAALTPGSSGFSAADGEQLEDDLEVTHWDGRVLRFVRHGPRWTQEYTGLAEENRIAGTYTFSDVPGRFYRWEGTRAQLLTYGLAPKPDAARSDWQDRARRRLKHLLMAGDPEPRSAAVTVLRSHVAPHNNDVPRDDAPRRHPPAYRLAELRIDYEIADPYTGGLIPRHSHAWLAVPTTAPSNDAYRVVLALNGHHGSAYRVTQPHPSSALVDEQFWYGEAFARRGYVVLAVDVSHRNDSPLYSDYAGGDDPGHGNGPHPSIRSPGFKTSDWEEYGERAWDAMRALDLLLAGRLTAPLGSHARLDAGKVVVTGLSMGGELTTYVAALDPRVAVAIPAGYSPDIGVSLHHIAHPCWRWVHADMTEYVDASDLHALVAPRPLLVQTGLGDQTYSPRSPAYSGDKQVARRSRVAFGSVAGTNFVHYLHDTLNTKSYDKSLGNENTGGHEYRVGDASANIASSAPPGVSVPRMTEPEAGAPWSQVWQTDPHTTVPQLGGIALPSLFDYLDHFFS